ncbi:MAG: HEXXH motif-containing putative peptide modification protein [Kofleriaceae bacterium]
MTLSPAFLVVPAVDDDLAATLAMRVRAIALRRLLVGPLPATPASAIVARHRRALVAARHQAVGRAELDALAADLDVQACALALDAGVDHAAAAAATLAARLDRGAPFDDALPVTPTLPGLGLATVDRNPLATLEAHPDKTGNALDLGGRSVAAWTAALTIALDAIAAALPALHAELAVTLRRIVPVGFDAERHLSCSYREAPGLIYLSLHPDPLTLAEAIVHETQHGKLNLLSWLDPLVTNPASQTVASPARPDPRPLLGVLLAAHAFVAVEALHAALAELGHPLARGATARRRQVRAANREALDTLAQYARPTATGARVVAALEDVYRALG